MTTESRQPIVIAGLSLPLVLLVAVFGAAAAAAILMEGPLGVGAVFGFFAFCIFFQAPVTGLYLTTALLLLSGQAGILAGGNISVTAAKVAGAATFAAWAAHAVVYGKAIRLNAAIFAVIAFLLWMLLSTLTGLDPDRQFAPWTQLGTIAAYFFLSCQLLDSQRRIKHFVILLCLCGFVMSIFSVVQYFFPTFLAAGEGAGQVGGAVVDTESLSEGAATRVSGSLGHSNWLSLGLLLLLPLNIAWFFSTTSRPIRLFIGFVVLLEIAALVLTFTRMGLTVGVIIAAGIVFQRVVRITPYRVAALAVAGAIGIALVPPAYKERVLSFGQYTGSKSISVRLQLQDAGWNIWQEAPIMGHGMGGFGLALEEFPQKEMQRLMRMWSSYLDWDPIFLGAHNLYLQTLVEGGFVALFVFLIILSILFVNVGQFLRQARERDDKMAERFGRGVQLSLISFVLCAVFLHAMLQKIEWMVFAVATVLPRYYFSGLNNRDNLDEGAKK